MTTKLRQKQEFAGRLRALREAKKWSKRKLAQTLGVHPSLISRYEAAKHLPDSSSLLQLAQALGASVDDLLGHGPEAAKAG